MTDQIIEMMTTHGEMSLLEIQRHFKSVNPKTLSSCISRMLDAELLTRRKAFTEMGNKWLYCLIDRGPYLLGEPDYCYYLRNLPNHSLVEHGQA
jgi:DNA-binding HxlR family transcriptional regulator